MAGVDDIKKKIADLSGMIESADTLPSDERDKAMQLVQNLGTVMARGSPRQTRSSSVKDSSAPCTVIKVTKIPRSPQNKVGEKSTPRKRGRPRKEASASTTLSSLGRLEVDTLVQSSESDSDVLSARPKRARRKPGRFSPTLGGGEETIQANIKTQFVEIHVAEADPPIDSVEDESGGQCTKITVNIPAVVETELGGTKQPNPDQEHEAGEIEYIRNQLLPSTAFVLDPKQLNCYICIPPYERFRGKDREGLASHMKEKHLVEKSDVHGLECPMCKQVFKLGKDFREDFANKTMRMTSRRVMHHMIREHRVQYPEFAKLVKCPDCEFHGIDKKDIQLHQENKHRLKCKLCKKLVRRNYIERHIRSQHSQQVELVKSQLKIQPDDGSEAALVSEFHDSNGEDNDAENEGDGDERAVVKGEEEDENMLNRTLDSTLEDGEIKLSQESSDSARKRTDNECKPGSGNSTKTNSEGRSAELFDNPQWESYFRISSWDLWDEVTDEEIIAQEDFSGKPRPCLMCIAPGKQVLAKSSSELAKHIHSHHFKRERGKTGLECPECNKIFRLKQCNKKLLTKEVLLSMVRVLLHLVKQHKEEFPLSFDVRKCPLCDYVGANTKAINSHLRKKHGYTKAECPHCKKYFLEAYLPLHIEHVHGLKQGSEKRKFTSQCPICLDAAPFASPLLLTQHVKDVHLSVGEDADLIKCPECPQKFRLGKKLEEENVPLSRAHVTVMEYTYRHLVRSHGYHYPDSKDVAKYVCNIEGCTHEAYTRYDIRLHRQTKHSLGRVMCQYCEVWFVKSYLPEHIKLKHNTDTCTTADRLTCQHCFKSYKSSATLQAHVKNHHSDVVTYECNHCDLKTIYKNRFYDHLWKEHGENPFNKTVLRCEVEGCGFSTILKDKLIAHELTHPSVSVSCHCGQTFPNEGKLRGHQQRVHTEDRDVYPCPYCAEHCCRRHVLLRHVQRHHPEMTDTFDHHAAKGIPLNTIDTSGVPPPQRRPRRPGQGRLVGMMKNDSNLSGAQVQRLVEMETPSQPRTIYVLHGGEPGEIHLPSMSEDGSLTLNQALVAALQANSLSNVETVETAPKQALVVSRSDQVVYEEEVGTTSTEEGVSSLAQALLSASDPHQNYQIIKDGVVLNTDTPATDADNYVIVQQPGTLEGAGDGHGVVMVEQGGMKIPETDGNYIVVQGEETVQDTTSQYVIVEEGTDQAAKLQAQIGAEIVTAGEPHDSDAPVIRIENVHADGTQYETVYLSNDTDPSVLESILRTHVGNP